jgi:hypothetical protein
VDDDLHTFAGERAQLVEVAEAVEEGGGPGVATAGGLARLCEPQRLAREIPVT